MKNVNRVERQFHIERQFHVKRQFHVQRQSHAERLSYVERSPHSCKMLFNPVSAVWKNECVSVCARAVVCETNLNVTRF